MTLTKLDTLLKNETIDLTKIKRIVVENKGKAPYYNELIHTNAFSVDAPAKAIRTMALNKDTNAYEATDVIVAVVNADKTVSILGTKSKDVYSAMRQPKVLTVNEGADTGKALLMGFREFLVGNYDGLYGGAVVDLDITEDGATPAPAPVLMKSFDLNKTEITGKVGDVIKVSVSDVAPDNTSNKGINVGSSDKTIATAVDNLDGSYSITLVKEGTTAAHWVAVDGGGAKKDLAVTVTPKA